jgi:hypothetical protein
VQVIEQSTADGSSGAAAALAGDPKVPARAGGGWVLVPAGAALSRTRGAAWSPRTASGRTQPRTPGTRPHSAPRVPQPPLPPQAPASLGAAAGGGTAGSLWVFAALLLPFFLTAPWWARRERPSVVRRLMGVVSRLERPG